MNTSPRYEREGHKIGARRAGTLFLKSVRSTETTFASQFLLQHCKEATLNLVS